jgi:hypothetical protein
LHEHELAVGRHHHRARQERLALLSTVRPVVSVAPTLGRAVFLTCGRSARYHTLDDTPEHLDWDKIESTARWLERFVRRTCARPEPQITFLSGGRDDLGTLHSIADLLAPLALVSPLAANALARARELLTMCDAEGRLPPALADAPAALVLGIESALA